MFFSAAQTPPSHHSLALFHIVFLISPLSLPLYEVFPSPASFFFRIPRPRLAHSSCPARPKIEILDWQRSWIQDDEVLHSHFHMPSLYLLPTVTQHEGVCLRNSPSVSWALGPFTIPVLCYAVLVILASCHKNVTIALFSSLLCHALSNEHQRPPSLGGRVTDGRWHMVDNKFYLYGTW